MRTTLAIQLVRCSSLGIALLACSSAASPAPTKPVASSKADGLVDAQGLRTWFLKADGFTKGDEDLNATLVSARAIDAIDAWIDDRYVGRQNAGSTATDIAISVANMQTGEHTLTIADTTGTKLVEHTFVISNPIYVVVSNDWDTSDNDADEFERQELLHRNHPEMVLTHFVGPYTFTDPQVSDARRQWIVDWLLEQQTAHGDEIGLHVHSYCNFIETAGVTCRTEPVYADNWGRPEGYTVMASAYTEDEFTEVLLQADRIFETWGLPKPISFRAGGWSAQLHTLKALQNAGYRADTSAVNWARLDEWKDHATAQLYPWNQENWSTITTTSQPYYPSENNLLTSEAPTLSVLEVPDNGALVDYVTAAEMIDMFHENWAEGSSLSAPRNYSIGYHPPSYSREFHQRMDDTLSHIDQYLASRDGGPVVYARLADMTSVDWQ